MTAGSYSHYLNGMFGCGLEVQSDIILYMLFTRFLVQNKRDGKVQFVPFVDDQKEPHLDVVIYSEGQNDLIREKVKLAQQLRKEGLKVHYVRKSNGGVKPMMTHKVLVQVFLKIKLREVKARIKGLQGRGDTEVTYDKALEVVKRKLLEAGKVVCRTESRIESVKRIDLNG